MARAALPIFVAVLIAFLQAAPAAPVTVFGITNAWKYQQTTNFDGVNWTAAAFDDSSWPAGLALLYAESNTGVEPRITPLTIGRNTYYFRTHFQFTNATSGASLIFSNKIDDGAVFYLNGVEIQRVRMPPPAVPVSYDTVANSSVEATSF